MRRRAFTSQRMKSGTLERCTEGWAAGLVAASFSIRESESVSSTVSALSGKNKNIALILENEVFIRWSEETRDFLIHTSFLDRLTGPLCSAVTGNERGAELLSQLSLSNSFVIPLDSEDRWFRYHPLFRDFLLDRLEREDEAVRLGLYGKAGVWCLVNGELEDAVNWLIKAGEYEKAYPYISDYRNETVQDRNYSLWKRWVEGIPESLYETDPSMYVSLSWVSSMEDRIGAAEVWADKARACFERMKGFPGNKEKDGLEAYVIFSDLNVAVQKMDVERLYRDFDSLSLLDLREPVLLGELNWNEPNLLKTAYGFKGRLCLVEKILPILGSLPRLIGSYSSYIAMIIAEFYYERNHLEELGLMFSKNIGSITDISTPGVIVPTFILLARAKRARGDIAGAFHDIEEAKKLLAGKPENVWSYHLDIFTAALHLSIGEAGQAARYIDTRKIGLYDPLSSVREYEYIVYARYLMRLNRPDDALILLDRLSNFARKENQLGRQIELLCLEAICSGMKGNHKSAVTVLEQALALGMEEGYARTFIDEGEPMAALLEQYINAGQGRNGRYHLYARNLLTSAGEYADLIKRSRKKIHTGKVPNGIADLLTDREIEVFRLLAEKKSNQEIADQLFFSVSAVKQYNTRIYDKLGVKNRHEAIDKASEFGLIE